MSVTVGVPTESAPGERRVALVPGAMTVLAKTGAEVVVEQGAGDSSGYPDAEYIAKGARLAAREEVFAAEVILQVRAPGANPEAGAADLARFHSGQTVIGFGEPLTAARCGPRFGRARRFVPGHGIDAAHHPRAEHGCALVHGHRGGI